jgi:hypothetical protein
MIQISFAGQIKPKIIFKKKHIILTLSHFVEESREIVTSAKDAESLKNYYFHC